MDPGVKSASARNWDLGLFFKWGFGTSVDQRPDRYVRLLEVLLVKGIDLSIQGNDSKFWRSPGSWGQSSVTLSERSVKGSLYAQ